MIFLAGMRIKDYYENLWTKGEADPSAHIRLWCSPYKRARETARLIKEAAGTYYLLLKLETIDQFLFMLRIYYYR